MWPFSRKISEDQTLTDRMRKLESKMLKLDAEVLDLAAALEIVRDKVLRKMQKRRKDMEDMAEEDELLEGKNPLEGKLL